MTAEEDLKPYTDPCPQGCGSLTDDPYGGPCTRCWNAIYDQNREPTTSAEGIAALLRETTDHHG